MTRAYKKKYHYIYKTTCVVTGRYYVGMHSTDDLEDGYQGSGKMLWHSIRKHGKENHKTEILEFLPSREELRYREEQIVNKELLCDEMCMNLTIGGRGDWSFERTIEFKKKLSELAKANEKWVKQMFKPGKLHHQYGKTLSEEHIEKIRSANAGKKRTEEHKEKIRQRFKGKPLSEEHKLKLSLSQKGKKRPLSEEARKRIEERKKQRLLSIPKKEKVDRDMFGDKNPFFGRHHSEETKRKLSEVNKGKQPSEYNRQRNTEVFKGKPLTEEHKEKIRNSNRGKKQNHSIESIEKREAAKRKAVVIYGVRYESIKDAAVKLETNRGRIVMMVKSDLIEFADCYFI